MSLRFAETTAMVTRKDLVDAVAAFTNWVVKSGPKPELDIVGTQEDADLALIGVASCWMKRDGLAAKYMNNYLAGAPENPVVFPCARMLTENPEVKQLVIKEVRGFVAAGAKSDDNGKYLIIIRQSDFLKGGAVGRDWWGALGSFRLHWRANATSTKARTVIRVWGEDTYKWAPDDKNRVSQAVHQAASRLESSIGAKPFRVIGQPCYMVVNTGQILEQGAS